MAFSKKHDFPEKIAGITPHRRSPRLPARRECAPCWYDGNCAPQGSSTCANLSVATLQL